MKLAFLLGWIAATIVYVALAWPLRESLSADPHATLAQNRAGRNALCQSLTGHLTDTDAPDRLALNH